MNADIDICSETRVIGQVEAIITSPGYPNIKYPPRQNCEKVIRFQKRTPFRIQFIGDFELEKDPYRDQCLDFIAIRNGEDENAQLIMEKCDNRKPGAVTLIGSSVWIKFVPDGYTQKKGFSVKVIQLAYSKG